MPLLDSSVQERIWREHQVPLKDFLKWSSVYMCLPHITTSYQHPELTPLLAMQSSELSWICRLRIEVLLGSLLHWSTHQDIYLEERLLSCTVNWVLQDVWPYWCSILLSSFPSVAVYQASWLRRTGVAECLRLLICPVLRAWGATLHRCKPRDAAIYSLWLRAHRHAHILWCHMHRDKTS